MRELAGERRKPSAKRRTRRLGTQIQAQTQSISPPSRQGDGDPGSNPPTSGWEHERVRKHPEFRSRVLKGTREVTVYVPPGYDEDAGRVYPLLILQDGQNLFDPETSFVRGQTWRVAETADKVIGAGVAAPMVIAGVANGGEKRLAEYTPSRDWKMGGGDAWRYGDMVLQELLPFLRSAYRVTEESAETGIGGSSLGGLVSLWLGLRYPESFGKLAVLSPSVWWNNKYIVSYVSDRAVEMRRRPKIWLDVGDAEGRRTVAETELLEARLRRHGWREGADLRYECVPGGGHNEAAWARRVGPMLRFLFPAEAP
jgi:enterochelin esterase-like enzyme